jgi:solute carrier family 35 protein F3/4
LLVVFIMAGAQTASSELTSLGLSHLNAPFFTMYIHTVFMVMLAPLMALFEWCCSSTASKASRDTWRSTLWLDGQPQEGVCVPPLAWLAAEFYLYFVPANYAYARALVYASPGLVTATFSSCSAFVAVLSYFWLNEPMTGAKIASVGLAIAGILVPVYSFSNGGLAQGKSPSLGVAFALLSSVSAAVYKVLYKARFPGDLSVRQLSVFLTLMGGINVLLGTVPCILLGASGVEESAWSLDPPLSALAWGAILGGSVLVLVFNTSIAIGIAITTPLFISIGTEITIPATMVVDGITKGVVPPWQQCLGALLLVLSFVVLVLAGISEGKAGGHGRARSRTPQLSTPAFSRAPSMT